jgi:hypothetical protein
MIAEKDGSFTINCKQGEITMSTRSFGMVGKTYKSASEAFKDADYYVAIERPKQNEHGLFWGFLGALLFVGVFGYGFFLTINRF